MTKATSEAEKLMTFDCLRETSSMTRYGSELTNYIRWRTFQTVLYKHRFHTDQRRTWERAALRVKDTEREKTNQYLECIRDTHDPTLHLKTIEDELKGTIGKALGKQAEKIFYAVRLMQEEYTRYQSLLTNEVTNRQLLIQSAQLYNDHRKRAIQARWELLVHRQAAGFIVNNHHYVMQHYPIADPIPVELEGSDGPVISQTKGMPAKKGEKFGDQLDWWQCIGRWK